MLYDKLAKIVETNFGENTVKFVSDAALFDLRQSKTPQTEIDPNTYALPFPTVAIQTENACTIVRDCVPGQLGLSQPREFLEIRMCGADSPQYSKISDKLLRRKGDIFVLVLGRIDSTQFVNGAPHSEGLVFGVYMFNGSTFFHRHEKVGSVLQNHILAHCMDNLLLLCGHNKEAFQTELPKQVRTKKMILRSSDRPVHKFCETV